MFSKDLGIDLGTMFTRLADSTQVLSEEPTIVAIEVADQKMVAVGQEARDMMCSCCFTLPFAQSGRRY